MATANPRHRKSSLGDVLVVEDDGILALDLAETLRENGAKRVKICATSSEALTALRDAQPDIVILDVHLADRDDGWAIAELIGAMGPDGPKVIFSTGSPQDIPDDIAAFGPVLEKPYSPEALLKALESPRKGLLGKLKRVLG